MSTPETISSMASLTDLTASMSIQSTQPSQSPSTDVSTHVSSVDHTPDNEREYDNGSGSASAAEEEPHGVKGEKRGRTSNRVLDANDRRTVFIPNLPRDAREREVRNLCAFANGFIKVQLYDQLKEGANGRVHQHSPGEQQSNGVPHTNFGCFILFENASQAVAARDHLHGYVFDAAANPPVVLQARIAMKNLFLSNSEQSEFIKTSRRGSFAANHAQNVIPPAEGATTYPQGSPTQNQPGGAYSPILAAAGSTPPGFGFMNQHSPVLNSVGYGAIPPALAAASGYYSPVDASTPVSPQHSPVQAAVFAQQMQAALNLQLAQVANGQHPAAAYRTYTNGHATLAPLAHPMMQQQHHNHHSTGHSNSHHNHGHGVGPFNPPCTTLFLARLDALSNDELLQMMINSFPTTLKEHKFMIDSKGQRIAFVEFESIESATAALYRMNNFMGMAVAFSKNPLNVRK